MTTCSAWLIFIGIDFLFHASILESLWKEEIAAFKPQIDLFLLIPIGYLSFLLLTILVGYVFSRIFMDKPSLKEAAMFGLTFGLLYAIGNMLALYSFVNIPVTQLVVFHLIYIIEIWAVVYICYLSKSGWSNKKLLGRAFMFFFGSVVLGIVIQNLI
jgi:predicted permease